MACANREVYFTLVMRSGAFVWDAEVPSVSRVPSFGPHETVWNEIHSPIADFARSIAAVYVF